MNNKVIIGIIVVVIIVVGAFAFMHKNSSSNMQMSMPSSTSQTQTQSANQSTAGKNAVTIQNYSFSPATITIKAGQSITWTNEDSVGHSATADDNSWDTGVLPQGQSKSIIFAKAGTYTYHCSVHPNMKATVIVQ